MCMYMYLYAIINLSARIITCIYKDFHMCIYIYIPGYVASRCCYVGRGGVGWGMVASCYVAAT